MYFKKIIIQYSVLAFVFIFALPLIVSADYGKVVGISDGDTITVLINETSIKIRLYGIDCPERGQDFGQKAKRYASDMVFGKTVMIKPTDKDRYGRTVAWVYVDGKSLNEELVKAGLAWHYKKYSSDIKLSDAELQARKEKSGLCAVDPILWTVF